MQIGYGIALVLYLAVFISAISAYALYVYSRRMLDDAWEQVMWTGIAMTLSPWTTGMLFFLPAFMPWPIILLVGIIAPYASTAARLRRAP